MHVYGLLVLIVYSYAFVSAVCVFRLIPTLLYSFSSVCLSVFYVFVCFYIIAFVCCFMGLAALIKTNECY